jgi:arginyl-tRNA synthetase
VATARTVLDQSRPDLDEATRAGIAPQVGIGAVKYADLSVAHDSEYVFDLDRMTALHGDTGPYLQYAAARIRSILRRADQEPAAAIELTHAAERTLSLRVLDFGDVVAQVGAELEPHRLCGYLFELARAYSVFYEECPVLTAEPEVRASRLGLCALTLDVLVQGLDLLGIEAPERM